VKYTQDVNVGRKPEKVRNPVMTIMQDSDLTFHLSAVFVPDLWEASERLRFFIDTGYDFLGCWAAPGLSAAM